jgi:hypothetical protein
MTGIGHDGPVVGGVTGAPVVGWGATGVTVRELPGWSGWQFRLTPIPVGDRLVVGAVQVIAPAGQPVTVETYKRVPIGTLLRMATDPRAAVDAHVAGLVPNAAELCARPYTPEHLAAVALVYRYAVSQGVAPRPVLVELFGVVTKTVDRWLRRARARGLVGSYDEERAKITTGSKQR